MKKIIIVLLALTLSACGSSQSASSSDPAKSLFSLWTRVTPSTGSTLDYTGVKLGTNAYAITVSGVTCNCTLTITGVKSRSHAYNLPN